MVEEAARQATPQLPQVATHRRTADRDAADGNPYAVRSGKGPSRPREEVGGHVAPERATSADVAERVGHAVGVSCAYTHFCN